MDEAIRLIRHTQSANRSEFADKVTEERERNSEQTPAYQYVGKNADTGEGVIKSPGGDETVTGQVITSGSIKEGQQVSVAAASGLTTINQMPSPSPKLKTTSTQKPKSRIKYLFITIEGGKKILRVGGWQQDSIVVGELPQDTVIIESALNNLGGDDWSVDLVHRRGQGLQTVTTLETFSSDDQKNWKVEFPYSEQLPNYHTVGHGFFWTSFDSWQLYLGSPLSCSPVLAVCGYNALPGKLHYWFNQEEKTTNALGGIIDASAGLGTAYGGPYSFYDWYGYVGEAWDIMLLPGEGFENSLIKRSFYRYTENSGSGIFYGTTRINESGTVGLGGSVGLNNTNPKVLWLTSEGTEIMDFDNSSLPEGQQELAGNNYYFDVDEDSFSIIAIADFLHDSDGNHYETLLLNEDKTIKVRRYNADGSSLDEVEEQTYKVDQELQGSVTDGFRTYLLGASYHD